MAPPPEVPLPQRLMALAQTLQFGWFVGYVFLLFPIPLFISFSLSIYLSISLTNDERETTTATSPSS